MFNSYSNSISNYNLNSNLGSGLSSYNSNLLYGGSSSLYFSNNLVSSCPTCHGPSNHSNPYIGSFYKSY